MKDIGMPTPCTTSDAEATCMGTRDRERNGDENKEIPGSWMRVTITQLQYWLGCHWRTIVAFRAAAFRLPRCLFYFNFSFQSSFFKFLKQKINSIKKSNFPKPHAIFVFSFLIKGMFSDSTEILLKQLEHMLLLLKKKIFGSGSK